MVESMHGEGDLMRGDEIEAQLLREELPDEAVHVLVGSKNTEKMIVLFGHLLPLYGKCFRRSAPIFSTNCAVAAMMGSEGISPSTELPISMP